MSAAFASDFASNVATAFPLEGLHVAQTQAPSRTVVLIVLGVFLLLTVNIVVFFVPLFLMLMHAKSAGVGIALADIFGMKLRKLNARLIVDNAVRVHKAGLRIHMNKIETHYLAGGRVDNVVTAMILARDAKIDLPWDIATAIDLAGRDILASVQSAITPLVLTCPAPGGRHTSIEATSKDGVRFAVKAKVTVKTNITRLVGGATEETLIERVARGLQTVVASMDGRSVAEHQRDMGQWIIDSPVADGTAFEVLSVEVQVRQLG